MRVLADALRAGVVAGIVGLRCDLRASIVAILMLGIQIRSTTKANPLRGGGAKPKGLSVARERRPGYRTVVGSR